MGELKISVGSLHGKFDAFTTLITTSYVAKETFEEYKKGRNMERLTTILVSSMIAGLVGYFLANIVK